MAFNSSGVNGMRRTVSVSFVGVSENGLMAPAGSRYLNVARSSLSVLFQVFGEMPRFISASMKDRATERLTCASSSAFLFSLRMNSANRRNVDWHCEA